MANPLIAIHDANTGITEQREMTDAEYAQWQADQDAANAHQALLDQQRAEAAAAKASAASKLQALGLTDQEIAAITGGAA